MRPRGRAALAWVALLVVLFGAAALRGRLVGMPLERDEGEYAYAGQLLLKGAAPYLEMYTMKLPGIYACYALLLAVFGQSPTGIHLGLLMVNGLTVLLVFLLARALAGPLAALSAAAFFAVLSVSPAVQGTQANAEHFLLPPVVGAALLLWRQRGSEQPTSSLWVGLLLGLGFVIKQHGAAFLAWGALWLLATAGGRARRRLVTFVTGALLPYAGLCLAYLGLGRFREFWFWTVTYAGHYVSMQSLWDGLAELGPRLDAIGQGAGPIALLGLVGLVGPPSLGPAGRSANGRRPSRGGPGFLASFAFFSAAAVCPGLYFRPHYFILALPALAIAAGAGVAFLAGLGPRRGGADATPGGGRPWTVAAEAAAVALAMAALAQALAADRKFLFRMTPLQATRRLYASEPFPEAVEVGRFLEANTRADERVAVLGSEPEIYFYARRQAATGFIYMYPLVEAQPDAPAMQHKLVAEVEAARPRFLVYVDTPYSWDLRPGSDREVLRWLESYTRERYHVVGRADLDGSLPPRFEWGRDVSRGKGPQLLVFERLTP